MRTNGERLAVSPRVRSWRERRGRGIVGLTAGVAMLVLAAMPSLAAAAGLTEADYRYLATEFGLGKDSFALTNMTASDAARLHDVISGPAAKEFPQSQPFNVADVLFDVEMRTCQAWQLAHAARTCPQVGDERLVPGWEIAERNCIACHLTGTTDAPSFFKLVQSGPVNEDRLAAALRSGHKMSPITFEPQQLQDLARYINSLR
jgi:mono/diheme cytochrome c family protein